MIGFLEICVFLFVVLHILRIYFADFDAVLHFYERFAKPPDKRLRGKVIWITGASSGIGEHLAYKLTEFGCKLVLSARRKDELDRSLFSCYIGLAGKLFPLIFEEDFLVVPLDITNFASHEDCVTKALQQFGKIDFLVNNAGMYLNTNVLGNMATTTPVNLVSLLPPRSSLAGELTIRSWKLKGTRQPMGYFNTLHIEVHEKNVGVTMICPGLVYSNILKNAYRENIETRRDQVFPVTTIKTERCVHLIIIAMANVLNEVWIAIPKRMIELYLSQYLPLVRNW
ncbi:unnamed protein product [Pocillopora meandrina]|uniref:Dehydrogenase/reductase SDR family member 7 n=1 Tax=Pocillopora meandrina TaxID=46732 RepID=A0AAU9X991_9CNID|nr:unnamed protein product [Pocillopora meandrina]